MIEPAYNVPSNEEISFKLTENLIPSIGNSRGTLLALDCSLDYSHSRVSIQQMLQEEEEQQEWNEKGSSFMKNSSLKVSSLNATNTSSLKTTPRTFRDRTVSSAKITIKPDLPRRLSFQLFEFDPEKVRPRTGMIHTESNRCWSERKRSKMVQRKEGQLLGSSYVRQSRRSRGREWNEEDNCRSTMGGTMQILQIKLKTDERREKSYLKRVLQSRVCSAHLTESLAAKPLWKPGRPIIF